jgi:hypothetical protein
MPPEIDRAESLASPAPGLSRPAGLRWLWTFGPFVALFCFVFGGALLISSDGALKVLGALLVIPGGTFGGVLVVAFALGMSRTRSSSRR